MLSIRAIAIKKKQPPRPTPKNPTTQPKNTHKPKKPQTHSPQVNGCSSPLTTRKEREILTIILKYHFCGSRRQQEDSKYNWPVFMSTEKTNSYCGKKFLRMELIALSNSLDDMKNGRFNTVISCLSCATAKTISQFEQFLTWKSLFFVWHKQHFYSLKEQQVWDKQGNLRISCWEIENELLVWKSQKNSHGGGERSVFHPDVTDVGLVIDDSRLSAVWLFNDFSETNSPSFCRICSCAAHSTGASVQYNKQQFLYQLREPIQDFGTKKPPNTQLSPQNCRRHFFEKAAQLLLKQT